MQNFIVLGIIPGTHYQTTLDFWIYVGFSLLASYVFMRVFRRRHAIKAHFTARHIARLIDQYQVTA